MHIHIQYVGKTVPGPCWSRSFGDRNNYRRKMVGKFLRCRCNELLKLWDTRTNEQKVVETLLKWHERIHAQLTERINEPMNQWMSGWISELAKQWINESVVQKSMNQWVRRACKAGPNKGLVVGWRHRRSAWRAQLQNEAFQWFIEWMKQWFNEAVNQSIIKVLSRWINESVTQWMSEMMDWRINE